MSDEEVYRTSIHFNTVYVIESPREGDAKTGLALYESVLAPADAEIHDFFAEYHPIETSTDLFRVLAMIGNDCQQHNRGPIIHIEAHGNEEGLELRDGTLVPWRQISGQFALINEACRMNLVVIAAMCSGWYLTGALMPSDRAPVFALVGPPGLLSAGEIEDATKRFYRALVARLDWNAAMAAMNDGRDFGEWTLRPATAEVLFCRVFREYQAAMVGGESGNARINELVAAIVRERGLDVVGSAIVREDVRRIMENGPFWYEHLRTPFLMLDLFPENRGRFGLSYDRCIPETGDSNQSPESQVQSNSP